MRHILVVVLVGGFAGGTALAANSFLEDKKPKHTIKIVMAKAHKGGLLKKVLSKKGSDAEKKQLVEYYTSLTQNTPPKGDLKAWKKRTGAVLAAAKEVQEGKATGIAKLRKATNCAACHKVHRGK